MNKMLSLPAVFLSGLSVTSLRAEEPEKRVTDRELIIQSEREVGQAYVRGDDRVRARLLSNDFRGIGACGTSLDRAAALQGVRSDRDESATEPVTIDVQVDGDTAIARVIKTQIGLAPELKPITDTWIKRSGR